mmetsp:Transcript_14284/g.40638  ORF Transcript_14284/g.40638 Transcript_14284/m.40638 type:complete len:297 (+) Transcript_14284:322-1212(+)|eukprot:CAMPEP_0119546044 /NCGR_PEP_ID=MMETSP1352-20130426/616_1 /TAXON_ID=265584 /ORGANISM="Stauroneis constricta, Strain CCMP1120" /LENGTH=296 /DNA_ID=CAMNT_0007590697 /DNA_START=308 /DNA_END=1198 /DNA_ORIENTATION=+
MSARVTRRALAAAAASAVAESDPQLQGNDDDDDDDVMMETEAVVPASSIQGKRKADEAELDSSVPIVRSDKDDAAKKIRVDGSTEMAPSDSETPQVSNMQCAKVSDTSPIAVALPQGVPQVPASTGAVEISGSGTNHDMPPPVAPPRYSGNVMVVSSEIIRVDPFDDHKPSRPTYTRPAARTPASSSSVSPSSSSLSAPPSPRRQRSRNSVTIPRSSSYRRHSVSKRRVMENKPASLSKIIVDEDTIIGNTTTNTHTTTPYEEDPIGTILNALAIALPLIWLFLWYNDLRERMVFV